MMDRPFLSSSVQQMYRQVAKSPTKNGVATAARDVLLAERPRNSRRARGDTRGITRGFNTTQQTQDQHTVITH